jgi:DNA adenine methylase
MKRRRPKKLRSPLKTHGGKHYLEGRIIPLLPEHEVYVEPCAGGLNVLINKSRSPTEIAGDIDRGLINFYCMLVDQPARLIDRARALEYTRETFEWACQDPEPGDKLDAALRYLVRRRFSRGGFGETFAWSDRLRGGLPGDLNSWRTILLKLPTIAERLLGVQFYRADAVHLIRRFDGPDRLFYIDPPYPHDVRTATKTYEYEMTDEQHVRLLETIVRAQGKVAISSYPNALYDEALKGWDRHEIEMPNHSGQGKAKQRRVEVLWVKR